MRLPRAIAFLFLIVSPVHAVPSISGISGDYDHGSNIVISGSGFGTHANFNGASHTITDHLATFWKDFEDNVLDSDRLSSNGESSKWDILEGATNRTNSVHHGYRFFNVDRFGPISHTMQAAEVTGIIYTSYWFQTPDQANNCGSKPFRIYYGDNSSQDDFYFISGCFDVDPAWDMRAFSECATCSPAPDTIFLSDKDYQNNTWHFIEVYANKDTGEVSTWIDGYRNWTRRTSCAGLARCVDEEWIDSAAWDPVGHTIDYGHESQSAAVCSGNGCGSLTGFWYFDDIYGSYTKARVVICNKSTWSDCTNGTGDEHIETQIPIAWATGEITVSFNAGSFAADSTAYVYVVTDAGTTDSEDVNSNGFEITVGGVGEGGGASSLATGPMPVGDFTIQGGVTFQ